MPEESMGHQDTIVQLMTDHQGRLYAYILSLLGNPDHANDVLQDTNVFLWRSIGEFRVGSNFKAWAFRIAHFQVMACRQRQIRDRLVFDDDLLSVLDHAAREMDETFEHRQERLNVCLEKLPEEQRDLLHQRYVEELSLELIASNIRKTANAVAQSLFRIRRTLIACVTQLADEGAL